MSSSFALIIVYNCPLNFSFLRINKLPQVILACCCCFLLQKSWVHVALLCVKGNTKQKDSNDFIDEYGP